VKITRSTRVSLKHVNASKMLILDEILLEYGRVVNAFIQQFWGACPSKTELLKPVVDSVESWFSARLRKVAAREAIDMIRANQERDGEKAVMPTHRGKRMCVSSTIMGMGEPSLEFDGWLRMRSIGRSLHLDLPFRRHRHMNGLDQRGKRLESYVITRQYVQFAYEIETGPKKTTDACVGIDTGIKALASLSTGQQLGMDVESLIERIKRRRHGSKGQRRAVRSLRQRMCEVAKQVCASGATLVVVENLKGITHKTKVRRRLTRNMRRSIGRWNVRFWLSRLQMTCEDTNVSFRSVSPWGTSRLCSECGHSDRKNRNGQEFLCLKCGHRANADVQASRNILARFITGPYGAGCKPLAWNDMS
jgi:putative transposase